MTHAFGVKDIPRVTSFLEMVNRNYYVISDSDQPAKEKQAKFQGEGTWLRYDQILKMDKELTLEDFYLTEYVYEVTERQILKLQNIDISDRPAYSVDCSVLSTLENWLSSKGLSKSEIKDFTNSVKEDLISDLTAEKIKSEYFDMLENLYDFLKTESSK